MVTDIDKQKDCSGGGEGREERKGCLGEMTLTDHIDSLMSLCSGTTLTF